VEVKGDLEWTSQPVLKNEFESVGQVQFEKEGVAKVEILGRDLSGGFKTTAKLSIAAYASILKTERKVLPGEILTEKNTVVDEIDFALPENKPFKGQIVHPEKAEYSSFQGRYRAKQTLLPGQPIPTYGIEKIPDMERGQKLRLSIISNGLKLETSGTAMEPGNIGALIKVLSDKNKKEFSAKIKSASEAEVEL
jgi:flagella basal body P-ring formation protein FlgA